MKEELKQRPKAYPPWTLKLRHPELLASPLQSWVEDDEFDVDYHVRRSALPSPGDERELGILVSRLHSTPMDFHRPPWETHLIEGLERTPAPATSDGVWTSPGGARALMVAQTVASVGPYALIITRPGAHLSTSSAGQASPATTSAVDSSPCGDNISAADGV